MGLLTRRGPPDWHPARHCAPQVVQACSQAVEYCVKEGVDIARLAIHFGFQPDFIWICLVRFFLFWHVKIYLWSYQYSGTSFIVYVDLVMWFGDDLYGNSTRKYCIVFLAWLMLGVKTDDHTDRVEFVAGKLIWLQFLDRLVWWIGRWYETTSSWHFLH